MVRKLDLVSSILWEGGEEGVGFGPSKGLQIFPRGLFF